MPSPLLLQATPRKEPRSSNIELFRVFAMMLIVLHHLVGSTGLMKVGGLCTEHFFSWKGQVMLYLGAWGKLGINCFVLITGYFMCRSSISLRKFLKLFLEIEFYNILIAFLFWVTGYQSYSLVSWLFVFWPIHTIGGYFIPGYLLFYFLIPFLNLLIRSMSERQHLILTGYLVGMYSLLGTFVTKLGGGLQINYVSWFCVLYLIGSFIRLYRNAFFSGFKRWSWITIGVMALTVLSTLPGYFVKTTQWGFFLNECHKPFAVALSVALFCWFKSLPIRYHKWINFLGATSFGVLLIHANGFATGKLIWVDILQCKRFIESSYFPLYALGCAIGVYLVCAGLDGLRIRFLEKPFFAWYDRHFGERV